MYCSKDFGLSMDRSFLLEVDSEELLSTSETQGTLLSSLVLFVVCRRNMVGSLPRGMPKVVDYRQTGAQATNEMMTQDRHEVLSRFGRREGVIPMSCV
jgi:hypothetical protein